MQIHHYRVRRRLWPRYLSLSGYLILIVVLTLLFLVGFKIGRADAAGVKLDWDYQQSADPDAQADGFRVERCSGSATCTNFVSITPTPLPVTTLTYTDTAIQAGTTYRWRVLAKGASGVSAPSNVVSFSVPQAAPQAPTNLRAIFTP